MPEDERIPSRGESIGRFLVLERIGAGGMGVVLAAYDPQLGRRVALKLLRRSLEGSEGRARLLREAQSMARLSHPNVLPVYEVGTTQDGDVFIAMELVAGRDLASWLKEARSWPEVLTIFVQAGEGLAAAHAAGIIHRDFKPGNALVGDDGRVRVLDFGLAGFAREGAGAAALPFDHPANLAAASAPTILPPEPADAGNQPTMAPPAGPSLGDGFSTLPGSLVGTPLYMAPEQAAGTADERSDQFAFCVALHEGLFGIRPFQAETFRGLLDAIAKRELVPLPPESRVPAHVRRVVLRGLRASPADRYPSMAALLEDLRRDPVRSRRRMAGAAAAVIVPLVIGAVAFERADRPRRACQVESLALVEPVWNADRASTIERAFLATGGAAPKRWALVKTRLDAHSERLQKGALEVCEATNVRGEQSAAARESRSLCLSQQVRDVDAQLTIFEKADAELAMKSTEAVERLPDVARCLGLAPPSPPPDDAAWRTSAAHVQDVLAQARALEDAGRYLDANAKAREASALAEPLSYSPLQAEVWVSHAQAAYRAGEFRECERYAHLGAQAADRANDRPLRAKALLLLAESSIERRELEAAALWTAYMRSALAGQPALLGASEYELGSAMSNQEQHEPALDHFALSRAAFREGGVEDERLASTLNAEGLELWSVGRADEARELVTQGLETWIRARGPDHINVATGWNNLGFLELRQNRLDEALAAFLKANEILEQWTPDHINHGVTIGNIASIYVRKGDHQTGLEYHEKALAIAVRAVGPKHTKTASALNNIASTLARLERLDEAREHQVRAVEIWTETYGTGHSLTALGWANLGRIERDAGNLPASLGWYAKAIPVAEKTLAPNDPSLGKVLTGAALTHHRAGDAEKARALLQRSLLIAEANPDASEVARVRFALSRASGRNEKSRSLAVQAQTFWRSDAARWKNELREVDEWLTAR